MKKILITAISTFLLWSGNVHAELITVNISATVDYVDDIGNGLNGQMKAGDTISGTYTYESTTPDTDASITYGMYPHPSGIGGIDLTVNGLSLKTNPNRLNGDFDMNIVNETNYDFYHVMSFNNSPLTTGAQLNYMAIDLYDPSGQAHSSDHLPKTAPNLNVYEYTDIHGDGTSADGMSFHFVAKINSLFISPTKGISQVISPTDGSYFIPDQKFDMAIILPGYGAQITTLSGLRNGEWIGNYLNTNCTYGPLIDYDPATNNMGKETILCKNAEQLLLPGNNSIEIKVMMYDGSAFKTNFDWKLRL